MSVFECENCGEQQTADKVLDTNAKCEKCGDTVVAYTIDTAKKIYQLSQENTELKEKVEELKETNRLLLQDKLVISHEQALEFEYAEAAKAKVKDLETQLAGRTYCHSDEAVEAKLRRYEEAAGNAIASAVVGPDIETDGMSDCYHVPFDDFDAIRELNSEE